MQLVAADAALPHSARHARVEVAAKEVKPFPSLLEVHDPRILDLPLPGDPVGADRLGTDRPWGWQMPKAGRRDGHYDLGQRGMTVAVPVI
jgi:hypothetical protein